MCKNSKVLQSFLLSKCDNPQKVEQWFNNKPTVSFVDFYIETITREKNDEIRSIALILLHKDLDGVLDTLRNKKNEKPNEKCRDVVEKIFSDERIVNKPFCTKLLSHLLDWISRDNNDEIQSRLIPVAVIVITFFVLQGYDSTSFWKLFSTIFRKQHCWENNTTVMSLNPFFFIQILTALVENTSTFSYSIHHIYGILPTLSNLCHALTNISQVKIFLNFIFTFYEGVNILQNNKTKKEDIFFPNHTTILSLAMENKNIENFLKPMIAEIILYLGKHIDKCSSPPIEIFFDDFSQVMCLLDQFIEKNIQLFDQVLQVLENLSFFTLQYNACYNGRIDALFRIYFASISFSLYNCCSINDNTFKKIASKISSLLTYLWDQNVLMNDNGFDLQTEFSAMKKQENCLRLKSVIASGIQVLSDFLNTFGSNDLSNEVISMLILNKFNRENVLQSSLENTCDIFRILLEENTILFEPFLDDLLTLFLTLLSEKNAVEQENTRWIFKSFCFLLYHFHKDLIKQESNDNVLETLTPLLLPDNEFLWETVEGMSIVYALCGFLKHQSNLPCLKNCCSSLNKGLIKCFSKKEFNGDILTGLRVIKRCITFDVLLDENWNFYYETAIHILLNIEIPTEIYKISSPMERVMIFEVCMKILLKLCLVSKERDINKVKFLLKYTLEKITDIYSRETESVLFSPSCNTSFYGKYLVLILQFLTKGLGYVFEKFPQISEEFSIHVIDNLCYILKLSHGTNETTMRSVSLNEESTRDIQEKIKSNYYKEKWNFIVGQEGITQLILKGENDTKDYIIQFNKTLLEAKLEVLQCFKILLNVSHKSMILLFHKIVPLVLHEALGGYILLNEAALQFLQLVLTSFLQQSSLKSPSCLHLQICSLPNKNMSWNVWQSMSQSLVGFILDHCLQLSSLQQCTVYLEAVKNILEVFETGSTCFMSSTKKNEMKNFCSANTKKWIESVCEAYRKICEATLSHDLYYDDIEEDFEFSKSHENVIRKDIQCQQTDWQGSIYTCIMCGCIALVKVFKEDFVTYFMKHLNTTFTSLLTLEKVNMKGRIAALMGYGELLHYSSSEVSFKISSLMLPICLLYIRPNYFPTPHISPLSLQAYRDNMQSFPSETGRMYAAIYCLGKISTISVKVFSRYIELAVSLLGNILYHPERNIPNRYLVSDISVSTLLHLYLNPDYAHFCEPFIMLKDDIVKGYPTLNYLVVCWLPLKQDKIEARNVLQLLLCILLETDTPKFAYFTRLMKSINNCHPIISNMLNFFCTFEKNALNEENPYVMEQIHKAINVCENWESIDN